MKIYVSHVMLALMIFLIIIQDVNLKNDYYKIYIIYHIEIRNFIFMDNGHTAICNICRMTIKVPSSYYSSLNDHGLRNDKYLRPEL